MTMWDGYGHLDKRGQLRVVLHDLAALPPDRVLDVTVFGVSAAKQGANVFRVSAKAVKKQH